MRVNQRRVQPDVRGGWVTLALILVVVPFSFQLPYLFFVGCPVSASD